MQFKEILESQDGRCAICRKVPSIMHLDHSHTTGQVRGILCPRCNMMVGFVEDAKLMGEATKYLAAYLQ